MTIEARVRAVLKEELGSWAAEMDANSEDWSGKGKAPDSLDFVSFIMKIEETFGIEISDDDAEQCRSIALTVSYLESRGVAA